MTKNILMAAALLVSSQIVTAQIKPTFNDPQGQTSPKSATVLQIPPINVDGDLSDWPSGIEKRSIGVYLAGFGYQQESRATGSQDNWFQMAWNDAENKLYVSGWSEDDVNVTQLSKWLNPDDFSQYGAPWFYDRYEIYIEYDNSDSGAYGYGVTDGDPGNVQYALGANDPDRGITGSSAGQETDGNGNIVEGGTMFFLSNFWDEALYILGPDGTPPFAEAKFLVELKDPSKPLGAYTKTFEAAITPINFFVEGLEVDPNTDLVDLGPTMNGGAGMGFDMTMMDRDGIIDNSVPTDVVNLSANNEGAWIGWSDGSKNGNPQLNGTLMFSMTFATGGSYVNSWELF